MAKRKSAPLVTLSEGKTEERTAKRAEEKKILKWQRLGGYVVVLQFQSFLFYSNPRQTCHMYQTEFSSLAKKLLQYSVHTTSMSAAVNMCELARDTVRGIMSLSLQRAPHFLTNSADQTTHVAVSTHILGKPEAGRQHTLRLLH